MKSKSTNKTNSPDVEAIRDIPFISTDSAEAKEWLRYAIAQKRGNSDKDLTLSQICEIVTESGRADIYCDDIINAPVTVWNDMEIIEWSKILPLFTEDEEGYPNYEVMEDGVFLPGVTERQILQVAQVLTEAFYRAEKCIHSARQD